MVEVGTATSETAGKVKLSDATNETSDASSGVAATPKAVKAAYDAAISAMRGKIDVLYSMGKLSDSEYRELLDLQEDDANV